ncbi:hypothetical protein [Cellvibrio sp.]
MADNLDEISCTAEDRKNYRNLVYKRDLTKEELKSVIHRLDGILLKTADLQSKNPFRLEVEFIRLCAVGRLGEMEQSEQRCLDRLHQYVQIILSAGLTIAVAVVLFKLGIKS